MNKVVEHVRKDGGVTHKGDPFYVELETRAGMPPTGGAVCEPATVYLEKKWVEGEFPPKYSFDPERMKTCIGDMP